MTPRKTLAAMLLALAFTSSALARWRTYALVTGISNYAGDSRDLSLSTDDAKRVKRFYETRMGAGKNAKLMTGKNVTRENVLLYIRKLAPLCRPTDQVVFFFSGHGFKNGLLTYDEENSLDYPALFQALREIDCGKIVMFIDACHSGSMLESIGEDNNGKFIIFSSSRDYEYSYETKPMASSFFTNALLSGLSGHADKDGNKQITVRELMEYMHPNISSKLAGRQHPTLLTNTEKNMDVVLADLNAASIE